MTIAVMHWCVLSGIMLYVVLSVQVQGGAAGALVLGARLHWHAAAAGRLPR